MNKKDTGQLLDVKLKESKEGAVTKIVANLTFDRNGRTWHSTVAGQGATRVDAVDDLAKRKMPIHLKTMFLAKLDEMDRVSEPVQPPQPPQPPKAQEPPVPSETGSEDNPDNKDKSCPANSPKPSPLPTSKPSESSPEPMPTETSKKPDGIPPEQSSNPVTEDSAPTQGIGPEAGAPAPEEKPAF